MYSDSSHVFTSISCSISWGMLEFLSPHHTQGVNKYESLCRFFSIICIYLYFCWRSNNQKGSVESPLPSLTLPHFRACPKPGPGFPMPCVMFFLCLMAEVRGVVCFVDIGVDHHCFLTFFS